MQLLPTLRRRDDGFLPAWPDLDLLEDQMHRLARNLPWGALAGESSIWAPRVDFAEQNGEYLLTAELPGIEPKDMDIEVDGNLLSIKGERKVESERGDQQVRIAERQYGTFERTFTLPSPADPEKINADFHQGVLKIRIQKRPEAKGKKIPVQAT